jgi:2-methylcitrate dehydratase PrpD
MTNISEIMAQWVTRTTFEDLPRTVIENAKKSLIDTIGVALAGSKTKLASIARSYATEHYATGKCNILGTDKKLRAGGAAFANCVAAHVLDYDDTCYADRSDASVVHASAVIVPAVWAACEELDLSGKEFLTSFVLGSEIEYFICRLVTGHFFSKGWFTASAFGIIGAAVGVAKAKHLGVKEVINAIGLAVSRSANTRVCLGTDSNAFSAARAAEGGVCASAFAGLGASAPSDVFEGPNGFLQVYNDGHSDRNTLNSLGKLFAFSGSSLWYKLFPVCTAAQAAAEVTLSLSVANRIIPEEVVSIHCTVSPLVASLLRYKIPRTFTEAQFSLPFTVACMVVFQQLTLVELHETVLKDERLLKTINKIEVIPYREGGILPSTLGEATEQATVKITMANGDLFSATKEYATGTPEKPMTDLQLEQKFVSCGQGMMPEKDLRLLIRELKNIESIAAISTILSAAVVGSCGS